MNRNNFCYFVHHQTCSVYLVQWHIREYDKPSKTLNKYYYLPQAIYKPKYMSYTCNKLIEDHVNSDIHNYPSDLKYFIQLV